MDIAIYRCHWKVRFVMIPTLSSLAAPRVVVLTTKLKLWELSFDDIHVCDGSLIADSSMFQSFDDACIVARAMLTHCYLMTKFCDKYLGRHWPRQWLAAWPNHDFPLMGLCGIYLRTISQREFRLPLCIIYLKNHDFKTSAPFSMGQWITDNAVYVAILVV